MLNVFSSTNTFFLDLLECIELVCSSMPDKRYLSEATSSQHMQLVKLLKSEPFSSQLDRKRTLVRSIAMSSRSAFCLQASCRIHQLEHALCLSFLLFFLVLIGGWILRCGHLLSLLVKLLGKSYPIYRCNVQGLALLVASQGGGRSTRASLMVGRFDLNGILLLLARHAPMPVLSDVFPHRDEFTFSTFPSSYRCTLFILQ